MMRKILAATTCALALMIGTAHAQFSSKFDQNGNLKGYFELQFKTAAPPQLLNFGQAQIWSLPPGNYTIPACDAPPNGNSAPSPQYDMWMGDFNGLASTNNPIVITCTSGLINGVTAVALDEPYRVIGIHWNGTVAEIFSDTKPTTTLYYTNIGQSSVTTSAPNGQTAIATTLVVKSTTGFPTVAPFVVNVSNNELELVTAIAGTTYTVTRPYNGSTPVAHGNSAQVAFVPGFTLTTASITSGDSSVAVSSTTGFPGSGTFDLAIGAEHVLASVTDGTHFALAARGIDGTTAASHGSNSITKILTPTATINQSGGIGAGDTSVVVFSTAGLPAAPAVFLIQIDSEHIPAVVASPTSLTLTRTGANGTTPTSHSNGANILVLPTSCQNLSINTWILDAAFHNSTGTAAAGGIDFGSSLGGIDIAPQVPMLAGDFTTVAPAMFKKRYFDNTAATPVCASPRSTWSGEIWAGRIKTAPQFPGVSGVSP